MNIHDIVIVRSCLPVRRWNSKHHKLILNILCDV